MARKPLFVRFIGLWAVLLAVTAVSFYLALLFRLAHPVAASACLTIAIVCFGGLQVFQFSRLRFVLRAVKEQKARSEE